MLRSMKKTSDGCCPPSTNGCSWIEVLLEYPTRENSLFPCFTAMNNNLKVCFDLKHALYKLRTSIISKNPNLRTAIINSLALLRARTSTFEHLFTILTAECIILYDRVTWRNITHGKRKIMGSSEYRTQIIEYYYYEIPTMSHPFCIDSQHTENLIGWHALPELQGSLRISFQTIQFPAALYGAAIY